MSDLRTAIAADLHKEVAYAKGTSDLYGVVFGVLVRLFEGEDRRAEAGIAEVLRIWRDKPVVAWFERPLLLAAALHRVAMEEASGARLARYYPSCGGRFDQTQTGGLTETIVEIISTGEGPFFRHLAVQRLQTNEISRGIVWLVVAAASLARFPAPIVLVEIGCSAGLNLVADRYGWSIDYDGDMFGPAGTPELSVGVNTGKDGGTAHALLHTIDETRKRICLRLGCDLRVPDLSQRDERATLEALIWGDHPDRLERLRLAMEQSRSVRKTGTLRLVSASVFDYLPRVVDDIKERVGDGAIVVFYNTVVTSYFSDTDYQRLKQAMTAVMADGLSRYRCIWVEHEPARDSDVLPISETTIESVVRAHRVHREAGGDVLRSGVIASTEMHPKKLTIWDSESMAI